MTIKVNNTEIEVPDTATVEISGGKVKICSSLCAPSPNITYWCGNPGFQFNSPYVGSTSCNVYGCGCGGKGFTGAGSQGCVTIT